MSNVKSKSSKKILNSKFEILNKIQPRTTKEFWVAQNPRWFWAKYPLPPYSSPSLWEGEDIGGGGKHQLPNLFTRLSFHEVKILAGEV